MTCGAENQTKETPMIGRMLDYKDTQMRRNIEDRKHVLPELDVVLYYGAQSWKGPKTLRELYGARLYDRFPGLCGGNCVVVIDLGALCREDRHLLTSDLGEVADMVRANRVKRDYTGSGKRLRHFVAATRLLGALSGKSLTRPQLEVLGSMREEDQTMEQAFGFLREQWSRTAYEEGETEGVDMSLKVFHHLEKLGQLSEFSAIMKSRERLAACLREIDSRKN